MNNGLCPPLESKAANLIETSRRAEKAAVKQTFAGFSGSIALMSIYLSLKLGKHPVSDSVQLELVALRQTAVISTSVAVLES